MNITATIHNHYQTHEITLSTNNNVRSLNLPAKPEGFGSAVNGGELLFLSLATCFCNDIYREAARRHMQIEAVEVTVSGTFGGEGAPAQQIEYRARVSAPAHAPEAVESLILHVDGIAEIHNTLRQGIQVNLK